MGNSVTTQDTYQDAINGPGFCPSGGILESQYKFNGLRQQEDENFDNYLLFIQKMAKKCEFGTFENNAIKLKLVQSIIDFNSRKHFLGRLENNSVEEIRSELKSYFESPRHLDQLKQWHSKNPKVRSNDQENVSMSSSNQSRAGSSQTFPVGQTDAAVPTTNDKQGKAKRKNNNRKKKNNVNAELENDTLGDQNEDQKSGNELSGRGRYKNYKKNNNNGNAGLESCKTNCNAELENDKRPIYGEQNEDQKSGNEPSGKGHYNNYKKKNNNSSAGLESYNKRPTYGKQNEDQNSGKDLPGQVIYNNLKKENNNGSAGLEHFNKTPTTGEQNEDQKKLSDKNTEHFYSYARANSENSMSNPPPIHVLGSNNTIHIIQAAPAPAPPVSASPAPESSSNGLSKVAINTVLGLGSMLLRKDNF